MPKAVAPARGDARAAMLEAAERLFAARGLHDVTMTEVAEAAGFARATVFNHFGSKHALVDAITAQVLAGYVQLLDGALADRKSSTRAAKRRSCAPRRSSDCCSSTREDRRAVS